MVGSLFCYFNSKTFVREPLLLVLLQSFVTPCISAAATCRCTTDCLFHSVHVYSVLQIFGNVACQQLTVDSTHFYGSCYTVYDFSDVAVHVTTDQVIVIG